MLKLFYTITHRDTVYCFSPYWTNHKSNGKKNKSQEKDQIHSTHINKLQEQPQKHSEIANVQRNYKELWDSW